MRSAEEWLPRLEPFDWHESQKLRFIREIQRDAYAAALEAAAKCCDEYRRQLARNADEGKFPEGVADYVLLAPIVCMERIRALTPASDSRAADSRQTLAGGQE